MAGPKPPLKFSVMMGVMPLVDLTCRPPLNWVGGKGAIRDIVRLVFPPWADRRAEHFCGGAGILFGTQPKPGVMEVLNDFDRDVVNFFLCVRERPLALMDELKRLPLQSEAEYLELKRYLSGEEVMPDFSLDELRVAHERFTPEQYEELAPIIRGRAELWDVRRAAIFYKVNRWCFNGTMDAYAIKPARLPRFIPGILAASKRLEDVVITNRDFEESYRVNDKPNTIHYFDPPYFKTEKMYRPVFSLKDHQRLHDLVPKAEGYVVISYNNDKYIRDMYHDCYILGFSRQNSMSSKPGAKFEELLITNFDPRPVIEANGQLSMFGELPRGLNLLNTPK